VLSEWLPGHLQPPRTPRFPSENLKSRKCPSAQPHNRPQPVFATAFLWAQGLRILAPRLEHALIVWNIVGINFISHDRGPGLGLSHNSSTNVWQPTYRDWGMELREQTLPGLRLWESSRDDAQARKARGVASCLSSIVEARFVDTVFTLFTK
jgi:hypothetical protein